MTVNSIERNFFSLFRCKTLQGPGAEIIAIIAKTVAMLTTLTTFLAILSLKDTLIKEGDSNNLALEFITHFVDYVAGCSMENATVAVASLLNALNDEGLSSILALDIATHVSATLLSTAIHEPVYDATTNYLIRPSY